MNSPILSLKYRNIKDPEQSCLYHSIDTKPSSYLAARRFLLAAFTVYLLKAGRLVCAEPGMRIVKTILIEAVLLLTNMSLNAQEKRKQQALLDNWNARMATIPFAYV